MVTPDEKIKTAANRATALTALAVGEHKSPGACLDSDKMAALVAGKLTAAERQLCLDHLASCQTCYDEWRALGLDEFAGLAPIIKGPWLSMRSLSLAAAGSLLAAAASLLLYLNIAPPPVMDVMDESASVPEMMESRSVSQAEEEQRLRLPAAPPSPTVDKAEKSAPAVMARPQRSKRKEVVAEHDMPFSAPPKSEVAAAPSVAASATFQEEKNMEALAPVPQESEDMVDIGNVIPLVLKRLAGLGEGEYLVLQTYKRDRSLTLSRLDDQRVLIREEGFAREEFEVETAKLKKVLKSLMKKEFPRSNKVHISIGTEPGR